MITISCSCGNSVTITKGEYYDYGEAYKAVHTQSNENNPIIVGYNGWTDMYACRKCGFEVIDL